MGTCVRVPVLLNGVHLRSCQNTDTLAFRVCTDYKTSRTVHGLHGPLVCNDRDSRNYDGPEEYDDVINIAHISVNPSAAALLPREPTLKAQ